MTESEELITSEQGEVTCPGCGYPSYAGHGPDCASAADNTPVVEATSDEDRKKFFVLFNNVHGFGERASQHADFSLKYFDQMPKNIFGNGERRVFIIRNENDEVIAGAEMIIGEPEPGRKEAYFGGKVVDEANRGRHLGNVLVRERIKLATESGCQEAWSLIQPNNLAAMRSIHRDGFVLKGNGPKRGNRERIKNVYYYSRDLTKEPSAQLAIEDVERLPRANSSDQLTENRMLIPMNNADLMNHALEAGYTGAQIALPKDSKNITEPLMVMERPAEESTEAAA